MLTVMSADPPQPLPDTPLVRELHERWAVGENPMTARRAEDVQAAQCLGVQDVLFGDLLDCVYRTDGERALYRTVETIFGEADPTDPARTQLAGLALPKTVTDLYAPLGVGHHVDHQIVRDWTLAAAEQIPDLNVWFYADYPYAEDEAAVQTALVTFPAVLTADIVVLSEADVQAKIAAVTAYRSQISTFWENEAMMAEHLRKFMTVDGKLVEQFWRLAR